VTYGKPENDTKFKKFYVDGYNVFIHPRIRVINNQLILKLNKFLLFKTIIPVGIEKNDIPL